MFWNQKKKILLKSISGECVPKAVFSRFTSFKSDFDDHIKDVFHHQFMGYREHKYWTPIGCMHEWV